MAFKKMTEYNEEKFGNFFRLVNDKDWADVIFLYRSTQDVLVGKMHYVKTPDYSGYVQCLERGCPACADGIRTQDRLLIPMLVIGNSDPDFNGPKVQFFDRSMRFQPQLMQDVFRMYPNPSEMIFRIVRHGTAGNVDTYYTIQAVQTVPESYGSYDKILADYNLRFPESYDLVCKDCSAFELRSMLNAPRDGGAAPASNYGAVPRGSSYGAASTAVTAPQATYAAQSAIDDIPADLEPTYVAPPEIMEQPELDSTDLGKSESIEVEDIAGEDEVNF